MFISAVSKDGKQAGATAWAYLWTAAGTALAGAVYEMFSFGVFSYYMIYAFAVPLLGGAMPYAWAAHRGKRLPCAAARTACHAAVAALTVGCLMNGALEIYGTQNRLIPVYWYTGLVLILAAGVFCLREKVRAGHTKTT